MVLIKKSEILPTEIRRLDGTAHVYNYIGSVATIHPGAQAYLAELPYAGARIEPHFHDVDQFQVFVGGHGKIGRDSVEPATFQYADAYTPYGPIVAGAQGMAFFTLRVASSGGHYPIPQSRHLAEGKRGRQCVEQFPLSQDRSANWRVQLLEPEPDGLQVLALDMAPDQVADGIASDGGGQYCLVCSGSAAIGTEFVPPLALWLIPRGAETPTFTAGKEGARILILQFPCPTNRPGSDPDALQDRIGASHVTAPRAQGEHV